MTNNANPKILVDTQKANLIIQRFALQLIENHKDLSNTAIIGLQPRGIQLAKAIKNHINHLGHQDILYGEVDHTFFRDDIGRGGFHLPKPSSVNFSTEIIITSPLFVA
jgi:pyrimidine operon attenuation protein/uracil phosphoribosyltransferase